ncbi:hypothetical protein [Sorangium sp. So ce1153]|uniref:hypothetical protein n=1 Tax=Sorangium sp. So ce1153 TaxID=3133333 RepID=UPI003F5FB0A8
MFVRNAVKKLSAEAVTGFLAPAGTKIAFEGQVDGDAYVYLVHIAEPSRVITTYPADGETIRATAGETKRVPATGWFVVPTPGKLLVLSSLRVLSRKEIADALDGRHPKPGVATEKDAYSRTGAPEAKKDSPDGSTVSS